MKIDFKEPPRAFNVGLDNQVIIKDMGTISLEANEQITFLTPNGAEYDVCRKEWGYYATPSINDRLKRFDLKTALVKNSKDQIYIVIVEKKKMDVFQNYLAAEKGSVLEWLDEELLNIRVQP